MKIVILSLGLSLAQPDYQKDTCHSSHNQVTFNRRTLSSLIIQEVLIMTEKYDLDKSDHAVWQVLGSWPGARSDYVKRVSGDTTGVCYGNKNYCSLHSSTVARLMCMSLFDLENVLIIQSRLIKTLGLKLINSQT